MKIKVSIIACLLIASSIVLMIPLGGLFASSSSTSNPATSWITPNAFLNYTVSGNISASVKLANGSTASISESIAGWAQFKVNGLSETSQYVFNDSGSGSFVLEPSASVTITPNLIGKVSLKGFDGSTNSTSFADVPSNGTTTENIPLTSLNFGNLTQEFMRSANSSYYFSPQMNSSLNQQVGVLYPWNSTTSVPALDLQSSVDTKVSLPSSTMGESGSYAVSGSSNYYLSMAQNIPLELNMALQGNATLSNIGGLLPSLGGYNSLTACTGFMDSNGTYSSSCPTPPVLSGTASGSLNFDVKLVHTNVDLSVGSVQQATVPVSRASLQVLSNSTITGAGTSGNQLLVNVTGPSGTSGVMNIIISSQLLDNLGITNSSQLSVSLDGQSYANYSLSAIEGSYVLTIYYHHSSHEIALAFGHANLGTNTGTIASLSGGTSANSSLPTSDTLFLAAAAVVVLVVLLAVAFVVRGRRKSRAATPASTPASP